MQWRTAVAGLILAGTSVATPVALALPAQAASHVTVDQARRACTHTSSGSCIRGGEFCPKAKWHKSGWDAKGRRYVCKGNHSHPHWMKP